MITVEEIEFVESSLRKDTVLRCFISNALSALAVESEKQATTRTGTEMPVLLGATIVIVLIVKVGIDYLRNLGNLDLTKRQVELVRKLVEQGCPPDKAEAIVNNIVSELRKQPSDSAVLKAIATLASGLSDIPGRKR